MDNLTPEQRRKNMQNIRSVDTEMEIKIRSELHKHGYRFRKNVKSLPGKPDIVFPKYRTVVFLDSCFWHKCHFHCKIPKTNKKYWIEKLNMNKLRDIKVNKILRNEGWNVLRFWEHQVKKQRVSVVNIIITNLSHIK